MTDVDGDETGPPVCPPDDGGPLRLKGSIMDIKRKPLLPRPEFVKKVFDYRRSAEDVIKRFPVTMAYLGKDD